MSSMQTRSKTIKIFNEEKMIQEKIERLEHYKLLESTYEADHNRLCDVESECYAQIEQLSIPLKKEIKLLEDKIIDTHKAYDELILSNVDESKYEAKTNILFNIEEECYAKIKHLEIQLNQQVSALYAKIVETQKEFHIKYEPYCRM